MLTIDQILAIVRDREVAEMKQAAIYFALLVLVLSPILVYGLRILFRRGFAACAFVACFLIAMATKPTPQITWDTGLTDNGTRFDTNNWAKICFQWNHDQSIASTEPVYFAAKHKDYPNLEWDEIGQSTAGAHSWDYTFTQGAIATNYLYYVFTVGEIHTNGVWAGYILQKTLPGTGGPDKMVIIRARLEVNGKQLAPFKEKK